METIESLRHWTRCRALVNINEHGNNADKNLLAPQIKIFNVFWISTLGGAFVDLQNRESKGNIAYVASNDLI